MNGAIPYGVLIAIALSVTAVLGLWWQSRVAGGRQKLRIAQQRDVDTRLDDLAGDVMTVTVALGAMEARIRRETLEMFAHRLKEAEDQLEGQALEIVALKRRIAGPVGSGSEPPGARKSIHQKDGMRAPVDVPAEAISPPTKRDVGPTTEVMERAERPNGAGSGANQARKSAPPLPPAALRQSGGRMQPPRPRRAPDADGDGTDFWEGALPLPPPAPHASPMGPEGPLSARPPSPVPGSPRTLHVAEESIDEAVSVEEVIPERVPQPPPLRRVPSLGAKVTLVPRGISCPAPTAPPPAAGTDLPRLWEKQPDSDRLGMTLPGGVALDPPMQAVIDAARQREEKSA